jgi:hypothetical protein
MAVIFVAAGAVVALSSTARAQSADPWIGTWRINLDKSTYNPGPKPTVPGTVTMASTAAGLSTTISATAPDGKPFQQVMVGTFDGKDNPVKGAPTPNTTTALKRIDGRTFEAMSKINGKPSVTTRISVSADGKTITATQTGTIAQGQTVNNVLVLEKQ